uniref:Uncharacterized protein n=1 Tax=Candidozyma auris TaxID=498019 RepID=A0A0L0NWP6_CANAR
MEELEDADTHWSALAAKKASFCQALRQAAPFTNSLFRPAMPYLNLIIV